MEILNALFKGIFRSFYQAAEILQALPAECSNGKRFAILIKGGSCKTLKAVKKSSFRASEARPGIQDFLSILDSGFRRNDA
jgi:hypothetical protein